MTKFHSQYICQQCGYSQVGWAGKCPNCGNWGSLVETLVASQSQSKPVSSKQSATNNKPIFLSSVPSRSTLRVSTKISELDRVLGGGLVPGQVVLLAGEPGIGKSTLLLQVAEQLTANSKQSTVFYICGEESPGQIKIRGDRLGLKRGNIQLLEDTDVDSVVSNLSNLSYLSLIIVDSIQTLTTGDLSGLAGSVGQVRECTARLLRVAKQLSIPLFLVGHVTKEGTVAGPAVLAHIVDTVLWFEGEKTLPVRILRAVKNRFGPTDEVGIFEMGEIGLTPVSDYEKLFLSAAGGSVSGSVITSVVQGTRPILAEIQALVVPTKLPFPKRISQGIEQRRLELIIAVLTRRCGIPLYQEDIFVNVSGGIKVFEPASDLAVALAIASAYFDKPLPAKTLAIGEVGLLGEIRNVSMQEKRIKEAKRLRFKTVSSSDFKFVSEAIKRLLK